MTNIEWTHVEPCPPETMEPSLADFAVTSTEKLRFGDTDRNGHITNSVFAVCCQNARMEVLCDPRHVPLPTNTHFVIAKLILEFLREMHWPGVVEVGTRVERIGRSSATLVQALFVAQRCVARAQSVVVLMERTSRRSVALPDDTAAALRELTRPRHEASRAAIWRATR